MIPYPPIISNPGMVSPPAPLPFVGTEKVGIQPKGLALAITTGACLAAGYSLLSDHDLQRTKKSVAGGSLFFLGSYLFIRGTRFDDAQTGAVVTACFTLAAIIAYARANPR